MTNSSNLSVVECKVLQSMLVDLKVVWYKTLKCIRVTAKEVNTIPKAVSIWLSIRYISDTGQYRCAVLDLPLFYIIIIILILLEPIPFMFFRT